MIPCFICGKDASTGWTKGFVPAPDSQKLALCAEHNTPENRLAVARAWRALLERELSVLADINAHKIAAPSPQTATVHFTGGGMLSFICLSCTPTEQGTLCIESPDGARNYIPLQHVREYSVRPCATSPGASGSPDSRSGPEQRQQGTFKDAPIEAAAAPLSFPASSVHRDPEEEGLAAAHSEKPAEARPFTLPALPVPTDRKTTK